jgi:hypothetical protein
MCGGVRENGSGRPESGAVRKLVITQLALWVAGGALFRVAVVPPESCPQTTPGEVRAAAVAAGDWLVRNMGDDGSFLYGYDRATGLANPAYNIVRHAGAVVALYQLVGADERRFLAAADRSLGWLLANTVEADDWAAVAEPGARAQLGTAGFTIVALLRRAAITGDAASNDLAAAMGRFVIAQQQPDGSILAFWDPTSTASTPPVRRCGPSRSWQPSIQAGPGATLPRPRSATSSPGNGNARRDGAPASPTIGRHTRSRWPAGEASTTTRWGTRGDSPATSRCGCGSRASAPAAV